jgi:hypothetical protein
MGVRGCRGLTWTPAETVQAGIRRLPSLTLRVRTDTIEADVQTSHPATVLTRSVSEGSPREVVYLTAMTNDR